MPNICLSPCGGAPAAIVTSRPGPPHTPTTLTRLHPPTTHLLLLPFQVEAAAAAALDKAESEQLGGPGAGGRQYMNMLLQLLRLRQACNHPWLVRGAPGVPDAFSGIRSSGVNSSAAGGGQAAGGARGGATAAEVAAVRRLAPDSKAALLQVGVWVCRHMHGCVGC